MHLPAYSCSLSAVRDIVSAKGHHQVSKQSVRVLKERVTQTLANDEFTSIFPDAVISVGGQLLTV